MESAVIGSGNAQGKGSEKDQDRCWQGDGGVLHLVLRQHLPLLKSRAMPSTQRASPVFSTSQHSHKVTSPLLSS